MDGIIRQFSMRIKFPKENAIAFQFFSVLTQYRRIDFDEKKLTPLQTGIVLGQYRVC